MSSSSEVFDEIKRRIIVGDLAPGEHLIESRLAEAFNLSRTPVREALRRLSQAGLVVFSKNQGVRVRASRTQEIPESYESRESLETIAARRAARKIDRANLDRLIQLNDEMLAVVESQTLDIEKITELNAAFHRIIVESTGS